MTELEARKVVAYCAAAYPGPPWSEVSLRLWAEALGDLPFDAAMAGAREMVRDKPNFPSVADVRSGAARYQSRQDVERGRRLLLAEPAPSVEERVEAERSLSDMVTKLKQRLAAKGEKPAPRTAGNRPRSHDYGEA